MLSGNGDFKQYEISVIPNDFNVNTILDLVQARHIEIPVYQRNYVWDRKQASRFIESLILGLPIPQIFLYQKEKNLYSVVDGQQRLLSIYFFSNQRFPRQKKRAQLRKFFNTNGQIPEDIFLDEEFFEDFSLDFDKPKEAKPHLLQSLKFSTLGEHKDALGYATIRCMAIRQNSPQDDDSSVFEIFNRLNTGGVNLEPEEIRASLYHSEFYRMIYRVNENALWRMLWGKESVDDKAKDVDALLRAFAMLCKHGEYSSPMKNFLNRFAKEAMTFSKEHVSYFEALFISFLDACSGLPRGEFLTARKNFNANLFDGVFTGVAEKAYKKKSLITEIIDPAMIDLLKQSDSFRKTQATAHTKHVLERIKLAKSIFHQS